MVSCCDQYVAVMTVGKIWIEIEGRIVRVVKEEKPFLLMRGKPPKHVILALAYTGSGCDTVEAGINSCDGRGIDTEHMR